MAKQPMTKGTHGTKGETFDELSFDRQAKSITGTIRNLQQAISANIKKGKNEGRNPEEIRLNRILQVIRMLGKL